MKRLKKAKFYDAKKIFDDYTEIYINPTSNEMNNILENQKESGSYGSGIRLFLNDEGRLYAWDGSVLHSYMKDVLTDSSTDIHICYEPEINSCYIHSLGGRDVDKFVSSVKNGRNNLKNAGIDGTCDIEEIIGYPYKGFSGFKTFEDVYEYQPLESTESTANNVLAKHDIQTRDMALAYIDGKFIQCYDHAEAVMEYLNNKGEDVEINNRYDVNDAIEEHNIPFACMHIIHSYPKFSKDKVFPYHIKVKAIYIEENTLNNITLDELVSKIKAEYPDYEIFLEDGYLENWDYDRYEKLAKRLKHKIH